jgi:hypothetical protein
MATKADSGTSPTAADKRRTWLRASHAAIRAADCLPISTAEGRIEIGTLIEQFSEESRASAPD